jgi:hypothetical protein
VLEGLKSLRCREVGNAQTTEEALLRVDGLTHFFSDAGFRGVDGVSFSQKGRSLASLGIGLRQERDGIVDLETGTRPAGQDSGRPDPL